jgi:predicted metal-dependent phosphoesterase TrpH
VVGAAVAAGLAAIALTDHDTVSGFVEARDAGAALGIRVVAGAELSAHQDDSEIHILALHVERVEWLESRLAQFRFARGVRAARIVDRLRDLGTDISLESVLEAAGPGSIGRPHIASVLISSGFVRDRREAFDRFLGAGRPAYVEKERLEIREAIELAHAAGAIAVWAHPGAGGVRARLEPLVEMGLDGVEVRHPSHGREDIARLTTLANHFSLMHSGGSDWHGATEGPRVLGCMNVPVEWLYRQDAVRAARAARLEMK